MGCGKLGATLMTEDHQLVAAEASLTEERDGE